MRHCVSHVAEEWVAFASVVDSVDDKRAEVKTGLHGRYQKIKASLCL